MKALVLGLAVTFAAPAQVSAQDAFHCIEELSDEDVRYRIDFIEDIFRDGLRHSRRWKYGWMGGWAAAAGFQAGQAYDAHRDGSRWNRFGFAYLAAGGAVLTFQHAFAPAPDTWALRRMRKMPNETPEDRKKILEYGTRKLKSASFTQDFYGGPGGPVLSLVFGVIGGSIKAAKWPGKTRGYTASVFLSPFILAMVRALGSPKHAYFGWEKYRGIACTGKYYDKGGETLDLDVGLGVGTAHLTIKF